MAKIKVILNPRAGRGYAAKISPLIRDTFTALGADFDLEHTTGVGVAIAMTERALDAGFDTIVAVGGDGTSHEVINGLMARAQNGVAGTLGCIPGGSGNDFAVMNGAPTDVEAACRQIVAGATRIIDLGKVTLDNGVTRYFDNAVGIGFDGIVTIECRKAKYLRGMALYLPVVLKTVFLRKLTPRVVVECDGETFRQTTLMTVICNGPREGGGFLVAPTAKTDDGLLDLVMTESMPKLQVLGMVPRYMKGTHIGDPRVKSRLAKHVLVTSPDPLYLHADGEVLCDVAHRVETWVVPSCLRIIAPQP